MTDHLGFAPVTSTRAQFTLELADLKLATSGDTTGDTILRGHAAVFNRLSHDLGGFRVKVAPGAFTQVLDTNPDVHLLWDHDTRYTLARTRNKTLELREDPVGLHVYARLAPTTYTADLVTLMQRGDIDQMSFALDIGADEWTEDSDGNITRTILEAANLYDCTVCAQGAFPQTDSQIVKATLEEAIKLGRVPGRANAEVALETAGSATPAGEPGTVAPSVGGRKRHAMNAKARIALHTHT